MPTFGFSQKSTGRAEKTFRVIVRFQKYFEFSFDPQQRVFKRPCGRCPFTSPLRTLPDNCHSPVTFDKFDLRLLSARICACCRNNRRIGRRQAVCHRDYLRFTRCFSLFDTLALCSPHPVDRRNSCPLSAGPWNYPERHRRSVQVKLRADTGGASLALSTEASCPRGTRRGGRRQNAVLRADRCSTTWPASFTRRLSQHSRPMFHVKHRSNTGLSSARISAPPSPCTRSGRARRPR